MIDVPGSILTLGLGGSPSRMITLGYGVNTTPPPSFSQNGNYYLEIDPGLSIMIGVARMSNWNTAGRPASPLIYTFGYNTDTGNLEMWNGSKWAFITFTVV